MAPARPCVPEEPVAPWEPLGPVKPIEPCAPAKPVAPVGPWIPAAPWEANKAQFVGSVFGVELELLMGLIQNQEALLYPTASSLT